ncbi:hypothetical protein EMEDMD4_240101 [Sinorhizobium medicae]|uniref:Uncharacterized protein n=1 Tax=Sinorhizobium medicae TaxID=110321 RepID=A0A508WYY4_9HYPH|nr:hypothetical protein EMEDMD4_240101 [Sinorhizobium medicae]
MRPGYGFHRKKNFKLWLRRLLYFNGRTQEDRLLADLHHRHAWREHIVARPIRVCTGI